MRYILSIVLFFFISTTSAEEIFPTGCVPLALKDNVVKLQSTASAVVMIHNLSTTDLWITHPVANGSASAGWSSRVQADHWSALALNNKSFTLGCIESRPGHEQQTPCSAVLAICQWTNATFPEKTSSTFWAGEDMQLSPLMAYIERRGFVLNNKNDHPN